MRPRRTGLGLALAALTGLAGCGGGSAASVSIPHIGAPRQFILGDFTPAGSVVAGRPTTVSFTVRQPNGHPLTSYRTGAGPHTGVHLIIVRDDLAYIIHHHPPIGPGGLLRQVVRFPAPGRYRVLVDVYPDLPGGQPNLQLITNMQVAGAYHPRALPPFRAAQTIEGFRVVIHGNPSLHAIQAQFVHVTVTDPQGRRVSFTPWFGALAHAIFFHRNSLEYFHTHVCGAGRANCTSALGGTRVSGTATGAGNLSLGVLLPAGGTWRLFLQMKLGGRVITAPFTLRVAG